MVYLPKSTEFLMAAFRVYEAMVISRFIELSLMWYGGEKQLMSRLGEEATLRYNLPPLCCCLLCLSNKLITRRRIKIFRLLLSGPVEIILMSYWYLQVSLRSDDSHTNPDVVHSTGMSTEHLIPLIWRYHEGNGLLRRGGWSSHSWQPSHLRQVLWQNKLSTRILGSVCVLQGRQWEIIT